MIDLTDEEKQALTEDEKILLVFQRAKIDYELAATLKLENLEDYRREYQQSLRNMQLFIDPILFDLGRDAGDAGRHATDAQEDLLNLSRRVKNLAPLFSTRIN